MTIQDVQVCHCGGFSNYTEAYQVYPGDTPLGNKEEGGWWYDHLDSIIVPLYTIWNESYSSNWAQRYREIRVNTPAISKWPKSNYRKFKLLTLKGRRFFI